MSKAKKIEEVKRLLKPEEEQQCYITKYCDGKFLSRQPIAGANDIVVNRRVITENMSNDKAKKDQGH
jgi:hypothetical protein